MSAQVFFIDAQQLDRISASIATFGEGADDAITDGLRESGPDIYERINSLIHPSGRRFKGHSASAAASAWPRYIQAQHLAITVAAKPKFGYLYFPDDGGNTRRHAGHQRFFERGAELARPRVVERCLARLENKWKEAV